MPRRRKAFDDEETERDRKVNRIESAIMRRKYRKRGEAAEYTEEDAYKIANSKVPPDPKPAKKPKAAKPKVAKKKAAKK